MSFYSEVLPQMAVKTPKVIKLIFVAMDQRPEEAATIAYKNSFRTCGVVAYSWIRLIAIFILILAL
jgi:hypothetical protein